MQQVLPLAQGDVFPAEDRAFVDRWLAQMQACGISVRLGERGALHVDDAHLDAIQRTVLESHKHLIAQALAVPDPAHLAAAYRMSHRLFLLVHDRWTEMELKQHPAVAMAEQEFHAWAACGMRLSRRVCVHAGLMPRIVWTLRNGDEQTTRCDPENPQAMAVEKEVRRAPPAICAMARAGLEAWTTDLWSPIHPLLDELIRWFRSPHGMPSLPPKDKGDPFA